MVHLSMISCFAPRYKKYSISNVYGTLGRHCEILKNYGGDLTAYL